jgi:hypothetical protein
MFYQKWGKPVTVAFIMRNGLEAQFHAMMINDFIDMGHKALVFLKPDIAPKGLYDHINIKIKKIKWPFLLTALYKLMERRKSKRAKAIIADKGSFIFFSLTKIFHKAHVYGYGEKDRIGEYCEKISGDKKYIQEED